MTEQTEKVLSMVLQGGVFRRIKHQMENKLKLKLIYFLLSTTSSMPLALYNETHTLV